MRVVSTISLAVIACGLGTGCDLVNQLINKDKTETVEAAAAPATPAPASPGAPTPAAAGGPTTEPQAVGTTVQLSNMKVTLREVRPCKYDADSRTRGLQRNNERLVGAHFEMEVTGEGRVHISSDFNAHDPDKIAYRRTASGGTDCQPGLRFQRFALGERERGWIVFRLPANAKDLTVTYTNKPQGAPQELATFKLTE